MLLTNDRWRAPNSNSSEEPASNNWGSAATANNIDSITMGAGDDAEEDEDAGGFPAEMQATADGFSMGRRLSRRSTSSLSSDEEEAVGFDVDDTDFTTARSTSPPLIEDEDEESGFVDATTLEDAYAAGLEAAGADADADDSDPVADAAGQ